MIPKVIHYCWFGGNPLPDLAIKCIESWKKFCPDYEIIEWNESNFNLDECVYAKEAYENKKWAFVTDYVRLKVLYDCGGIYMDTDVEVIKPLDSLLDYKAVSGFESDSQIPTGLMASEKNHPMIYELLHDYDNSHFVLGDGSLDLTTNVIRITKVFLKYGFSPNNERQTINEFTLLPKDYLCPKDLKTYQVFITKNTLSIHHFDGSWLDEESVYYRDLRLKLAKNIPVFPAKIIALFVTSLKFYGLKWPVFISLKIKNSIKNRM